MKTNKRFICSNCGDEFSSWSGKCFSCDEWNTLEEVITQPTVGVKTLGSKLQPKPVSEVVTEIDHRIKLSYGDVDRVLGGGIVHGSVNLLAGEPGIGKSTILMHVSSAAAKSGRSVLYISGEESPRQVGLRSQRLGTANTNIDIVASTSTDNIVETIKTDSYDLIIIDSIQTLASSNLKTSAGSTSQINTSTQMLIEATKLVNTAVFLVGHVTKDGSIAGPKVLEHMVDSVFQLEGDRYGGFKVLRSIKNRFGSTNETALFEMVDIGLEPVLNPSKALLAERQNVDGSVIFATIEGTRPLLVEVQALVNTTSFGYPKRTVSGIDLNRLNLLVAVLEKRTKLRLADKDIFINIVGGIRIQEPAADLAICMAIASAAKGLKLNSSTVVFGEVGLAGDVRHVPFVEQRMKEAEKLGYSDAIGPSQTKKNAKLHSVKDLRSALNIFLSANQN